MKKQTPAYGPAGPIEGKPCVREPKGRGRSAATVWVILVLLGALAAPAMAESHRDSIIRMTGPVSLEWTKLEGEYRVPWTRNASFQSGASGAREGIPNARRWWFMQSARLRKLGKGDASFRVEYDVLYQNPLRYVIPLYQRLSYPKHVMGLDTLSGYEIAYLAHGGLLRPLDDLVSSNADVWGSLPDDFRQIGSYDGQLYAVPVVVQGLLLVVDSRAVRQPDAISDWETFRTVCSQLSYDDDHDSMADVPVFASAAWNENRYPYWCDLLLNMALQQGSAPLSENGLSTRDPALIRGLQFLRRLYADGLMTLEPADREDAYPIVLATSGWLTPSLTGASPSEEDQQLGRTIVPLPTFGSGVVIDAGSLYACIIRTNNEKITSLAWEFMTMLANPGGEVHPNWTAFIPWSPKVKEDPVFQRLCDVSYQNLEYIPEMYTKIVQPGPTNLFRRDEALKVFWTYCEKAIRGDITPEQAIRQGAEAANRIMTPIGRPEAGYALYR